MATGNFTWFNYSKLKILNSTINLGSDTFKAVLCNSSQALSATFVGTSTNCQYSDLTGELSTANGYTNGGLALSSVTLTRTTVSTTNDTVAWDSADLVWTLTGSGITFKYLVIYDDTGVNKDLVCYVDADTGGGSISPIAGTLTVAINNIETMT